MAAVLPWTLCSSPLSPEPLRKLLAKAWTSSLVANKSPSVPLKISWEEARWGGGFRNAVDCDYRHSLGTAGWGQGLRGKSRLFLRGVTHALGQQRSQTGTGLIAKDLPVLVKGRKQFENYPFLKNVAFALEEFSIYSEVIISEWKMFVQEGKALRSVESNLTHTLTTPLDSSAQQQLGLGRILQGRGYFPGIAHLHQISLCLSFGLSSGLPWSGRSGVRSADFSRGKKKVQMT